ncbi:MAG: hypothetical protein ACJ8H8_22350, partial [Geminicoccaceae bacterium]
TTNTGSIWFVIWALIDAFAEAGCRECRHGSTSAMTRDVRRRILGSSSEGPAEELLTLLKQADRVDAAHRIAREGAMVLGWDGEAVGVPKQIIMARAVRRKVRSITKLTEAERSEYSVLAADTAKGLQSWLDTYGRELRTHFKG